MESSIPFILPLGLDGVVVVQELCLKFGFWLGTIYVEQ